MTATQEYINISTGDDPTLTKEMSATPEESEVWLNDIYEEFLSIQHNKTWERDENAKGVALPSHLVLTIRRDINGKIDRFKTRIFGGGNYQVYSENDMETYAPVVDFSLVRVLLFLFLSLGLHVAQVDIKVALLNGNLEENVWIKSSRGISGRPSRVYRLKKSLYDLKQAPSCQNYGNTGMKDRSDDGAPATGLSVPWQPPLSVRHALA